LLGFLDFLHHLVLDLLLLIRVEVLAVLFDEAPNSCVLTKKISNSTDSVFFTVRSYSVPG